MNTASPSGGTDNRYSPSRTTRQRAGPLRCVNCGYDLAGIATDGVCPECGVPCIDSIDGGDLRRAPPEHIRELCSGTRHAIASALVLIAAFIVYIPAFDTWGSLTPPAVYFAYLISIAVLVLVGATLLCRGYARLTRPNPRRHGAGRRSLLRKAALGAVVFITGVQLLVVGLTFLAILADQPPNPDYPATLLFPMLLILPAVVVCVPAVSVLFAFIATIARALDEGALARRANVYVWVYPAVMIVGFFMMVGLSFGFGPLLAALLLLDVSTSLHRKLRALPPGAHRPRSE